MAAALPIIAATAALATAGSTIYQVDQANSARSDANAAADKQQKSVDQSIAEQKAAAADLANNQANAARLSNDRRRQQALKSSSAGRNGTILTSPYQADSVPLGSSTTGTTILGA